MTRTIASSQPLPVTEGYSAPGRCPPANMLNRHWPRFAPLRAVMPTHRVLVSVSRSAWHHHLQRRSQSQPFPPSWADIGVIKSFSEIITLSMRGLAYRQTQEPFAHNVGLNHALRRQICPRLRIKINFLRRIGLSIDNGPAHSVGHSRSPSRVSGVPLYSAAVSTMCSPRKGHCKLPRSDAGRYPRNLPISDNVLSGSG